MIVNECDNQLFLVLFLFFVPDYVRKLAPGSFYILRHQTGLGWCVLSCMRSFCKQRCTLLRGIRKRGECGAMFGISDGSACQPMRLYPLPEHNTPTSPSSLPPLLMPGCPCKPDALLFFTRGLLFVARWRPSLVYNHFSSCWWKYSD